ncbi:arginyl-tRNA synthetase [Litorimonas taeanensis]|uniref:Arginine--tRNA ligase n=1 Tax=Litorimonas taeanensis TaxID=568099 RepID=A0A420WE14_9PROT|nr:arginine--tRNA ligase [Litorimonas taeanensis]RKQ69257.1 arginyl-tRNA synthetase [Litorimonas taeanensis]
MSSILQTLEAAFMSAFKALDLDPNFGAVRESDRPDLAPFQCNGAMAAAGALKKQGEKANPREIAQKIVAQVKDHDAIESIEIGGPGFINFAPTAATLSARAQDIAESDSLGIEQEIPKSIIVDYGGANVAKPMHVGHLRSAVIGEALKRLLRAQGHHVLGDVHMGDWGLQMGHLISELEVEQPDLPYFDVNKTEGYPDISPVDMNDLARLYPQASNAAKGDAERMERSRVATAELQSGRPGYRALLEHFINVSVAALKIGYGNLGVEFDLWKGEACVDPLIPDMIKGLRAQGITEEDDGALIIRVEEEDEKKDVPPVMLLARSGAVLYHTTDLATLVDRKKENDPDLVLYVVDQRQALHFEQVFRAAVKAGWYTSEQLYHAGFGTMNGKDGKPFKTREGGVLRLEDLIEIMNEAASKRLAESGIGADFDAEERSEIARKVGLAALKFADLQNQRLTNYIFDPERFTAFEGKTGPYLLYAVVRIKSLLRRAEEQGVAVGKINVAAPAEKQLVLALDAFGRAVAASAEKYAPHILCDHIYRVAQSFSRFYTDCHILADDVDPDVKSARLGLAALTLKQLEMGLNILGIEAPDRM